MATSGADGPDGRRALTGRATLDVRRPPSRDQGHAVSPRRGHWTVARTARDASDC